jgi:peptide/nickel transport system ATP-binding protein
VPEIDVQALRLRTIPGQPPALTDVDEGCPFRPRCERATAECGGPPPLVERSPSHRVSCWHDGP